MGEIISLKVKANPYALYFEKNITFPLVYNHCKTHNY